MLLGGGSVGAQRIHPVVLRPDAYAVSRLGCPGVLMARGLRLARVTAALCGALPQPRRSSIVSGREAERWGQIRDCAGLSARFRHPPVFATLPVGAMLVAGETTRTGAVVLPGALLPGVAVNLIPAAGVLTTQYLTEFTSALRILR